MRPGKVLLLVLGVLITLSGLVMAAGGGLLIWAHATQRDSDGYYASGTVRLNSPTAAIVSGHVGLTATDQRAVRIIERLGTVRLTAAPAANGDVFIGIARTRDVQSYLQTVGYDQVRQLRTNGHMTGPMGDRMTRMTSVMTRVNAESALTSPGTPGTDSFWSASAMGPGTQTLTWTPRAGDWTAVVMNANGGPGIAVNASGGIRSNSVLSLGWGLLGTGIVVLAAGIGLVLLGAHGINRPPSPAGRAGSTGSDVAAAESSAARQNNRVQGARPVRIHASLGEPLSRWRWLIKWLLVIPHAIVLLFLWPAVIIVTFAAAVAILITGRYPRGLFDFTTGVLRWQWRVTFYALTLGTDRYPPFSLREEPDYPARLDIDYPGQLSRPLVLVKWLLALPQLLLVALFGATAWTTSWNLAFVLGDSRGGSGLGITGLLALIAGVILLFKGHYPQPIFDLIVGLQRWTLRVAAYVLLMTDQYPPFQLDQGGNEPSITPGQPPSPAPPPVPDDALIPA